MRTLRRRQLLQLAGWGATGLGVSTLLACEAATDGLGSSQRFDAGFGSADAEANDLGEPDVVWLDASEVDAGQVDAAVHDAGSLADGGAIFVIADAFNVILNDPSCSKHSHGLRVRPARYTDDTPVSYLGGSHEVLLRPSELVQLAAGIRLPFATVGDGPGHGHCGTAWADFVGPEDRTLIDICETRGTAVCLG